jgi:hypothetical protein
VEAYADRARSAFFAEGVAARPLSTMAAFHAAANQSPEAARIWLDSLRSVEPQKIEEILTALPRHRCSEASISFARRLLLHNRDILLGTRSPQ